MKEILKAILNSETIARSTVDFYLNSMDCSESDYSAIYNHFAIANNSEQLASVEEIYTEKNRYAALVDYILKANDDYYLDIYKMILESITEKAMEGAN